MIAPLCQRWRDRRDAYRPAGEVFDPSRFGVEVIPDDSSAREFVEAHHYSGSYPAARCRVGLYDMRGCLRGGLVGVAIFSVPMQQAVIPRWCGVEPAAGVELGRFVLLDSIAANGETWFLSRAFEALRAELPSVRAVISYSDPVRRVSAAGEVVMPGHVGTIYQAHNGRHVGRGSPRSLLLDRHGRVISGRLLSKIRRGERGEGYAQRELERLGAPPRAAGEEGTAWLSRALPVVVAQRIRHPGNLAYVWPVGDRRQRTATQRGFPPALPYQKRGEP